MKKLLILLLTVAMLFGILGLPASAAHVSADEAIDTLEVLGLVRGTGNGFEPERCPVRSEALVMLLRLLGLEAEAAGERDACPFADGGWAAPYLTYAWKNGLAKGQSETCFGSAEQVSVRDYLTFTLRALGYSDSGEDPDFSWERSIAFADSIGLTHGEYRVSDPFLREDMALVSYTALMLPMKDSDELLIRRLYLEGAVSAAALKTTRLAFAAGTGEKRTYDAAGIHELCASAVFLAELYDTEENLRKDRPDAHGSGFFVTADGVAVLCAHELDGRAFARVQTLDGRHYVVTAVLSYDPFRDTAVVRVSKTDTEGHTVRFFPYLELGNSDSVYHGERVYTVSNPLGYTDCISEGIVSNPCRTLDDPAYPVIQITAPVSPGSSGGPMLNACGEVEGLVYGMLINGQNANLIIPINEIDTACFRSRGVTLQKLLETENGKKVAATLTASRTKLHLDYEEEAEILISGDYPGSLPVQFAVTEGKDAVDCKWGEYLTQQSVLLYITGIGNGEATIEITYHDVDGNDCSVPISVTVSGAPEDDAPEE